MLPDVCAFDWRWDIHRSDRHGRGKNLTHDCIYNKCILINALQIEGESFPLLSENAGELSCNDVTYKASKPVNVHRTFQEALQHYTIKENMVKFCSAHNIYKPKLFKNASVIIQCSRLISRSSMASVRVSGDLHKQTSVAQALVFIDTEACAFRNLFPFLQRAAKKIAVAPLLSRILAQICEGFPETFQGKICHEIHKERPLHISCHCDLLLASTSQPFPAPLSCPEHRSSPKSPCWTGKQPKETLNALVRGRRRPGWSAPWASTSTYRTGPDHTERVFRRAAISHRRHLTPILALPARIAHLPAALAPSPSLPGGSCP